MTAASIRALAGRIGSMVTRIVVGGSDDDKQFQELQIELHADEAMDAVEHVQPYGFSSRPKAGAEGVGVSVGGLRSHTVVIVVGDRRYRFKGLAEGEAAMHDDQGQVVHLKRDGIEIHGKRLTVAVDGQIKLSGTQIYLDSNDVLVGTGAALGAARKTDAVSSSAVTGGSTKVKIA